jgi:hypothetical protein
MSLTVEDHRLKRSNNSDAIDKRLTYYHDGTQQRLTDVYDNVLKPLLA